MIKTPILPRLVRFAAPASGIVADGDRVDAGKGLVEQHVIRPGGQGAGDLDAPPLAARQRDRGRLAQPCDVEFLEQLVEIALALFGALFDHFQQGADILFDIEAAKIEASCGR